MINTHFIMEVTKSVLIIVLALLLILLSILSGDRKKQIKAQQSKILELESEVKHLKDVEKLFNDFLNKTPAPSVEAESITSFTHDEVVGAYREKIL